MSDQDIFLPCVTQCTGMVSFSMPLLVLRKMILMDDLVLVSSCISNEQEEIQVSSKDFCAFLFRSDELEVSVDHLSMTEEFVDSYKYTFTNNTNIFNHISV